MRATKRQGVRPCGVTRREALCAAAAGLGGLTLLGLDPVRNTARADEIPAEYQPCVSKGLEWLSKTQSKDGHWEAFGGQYPMTMTALSGMAMLMQGSTIREGKYKDNIHRTVDWIMARSQPNGMLGNPNIPGEAGRYMYGHGYSLLFLSCIYGEEEEEDRRKRLEDILTRAAKFTHDAQTQRESIRFKDPNTGKALKLGGWGYVSAREGNNFDEGSVTITQVQALRAARDAGIAVPPEAIQEAVNYLRESTNDQGFETKVQPAGVIYSLAGGGGGEGRPALTSAAISCGFSAGDYNSDIVKKWLLFCKNVVQPVGDVRFGQHDEYTQYYFAQAIYKLGEDGWAKLFGSDKDALKWSTYRA
ncbi:MAG TPA: hypothetical protein VMS17_23050, partial [Gemmataceae bacterium]|nr:hypothetical protein [Gemmataceae bacterium]